MDIRWIHFKKHPLKEVIKNLKNLRRAEKRAKNYNGEERKVSVPEEYSQVFKDTFTKRLYVEDWRYAMPWGDFHPGYLHQYYDNNGTLSYCSPEGLVLDLKKIPKSWKKSDLPEWRRTPEMPDEFTIPVGVGFVSTKKSWQYGWFESWIKLPEGKSYWPAFWMSGQNSWPPEIDILEAYSYIGPKYDGYTLFEKWGKKPNRKIQPNIHYGSQEHGNQDNYRSYDVPVANCTERFVQYVCHWEKEFIRIYYDGALILECTDDKVLKYFNRESDQMFVIFNHGLHQDYPENPDESSMVIKSFSVYQKI
jgi:hypothetical protein